MEEIRQMDAMDFLSKILQDLSKVDESILLHPQLIGIRGEIGEYLGLVNNNQDYYEDYDEYPSCPYCGDGDLDPMTECPQCS